MSMINLKKLLGRDRFRTSSEALRRLRDEELTDLGLNRTMVAERPMHAPVEVSNDRV